MRMRLILICVFDSHIWPHNVSTCVFKHIATTENTQCVDVCFLNGHAHIVTTENTQSVYVCFLNSHAHNQRTALYILGDCVG